MKIKSWTKTLTIVVILLTINYTVFSQVVVERSKDKVVISGIPYYVHVVKKGETSYSISRAYGITVEELAKENPPAVYGVNEGQALRIPVKSVTDVIPSEPVSVKKQRDENKFIYHNLKPGETVYSLSKSYDVSENEIILSNPGIDINKLPVNTEIAVPRREFMSDRLKFDNQENKYIYHKVLKGESLSSIAEKYGLTVRELRRENRDLRFPQVGDFIRIPKMKTSETREIEQVKTDTVATIFEEPEIRMDRPVGYTQVKDLSGSIDVAVLLPFYLKENAKRTEIDSSKSIKGKKQYKLIKRPEDWIFPESLDFVEMYEGILLAADTLRSLGLDINLQTYDIKSDTIGIMRLISSGKLAGMDLIIGPVYSHNLTIVAAYASDLGIPVVSPVTLINNSALIKNPTLFITNSALEIAQKTLAKKISEYYDHNFVFIHADTAGIDEDVKRFKNLIFTELSYRLPYEEIKFKEIPFYSRSMFNNDSINRLSHALSEQSKNIVIIASEEAPVISETIQEFHGLSRKFDLKVFGYPVMRDLVNLDPKYFFDLDIMVYSPYWIDYTREKVKKFISDFRQKFLTEPSEKSYAWQGYDIAYYFLSGIAMHGKDFIAHPEMHNPDLLQTEYDFIRKEAGDGFENQKLFIIRYTKDYEVKLVEENKLLQQK
ncbi:MAG: LysM peptidoglycan-binding domain-containing protein [Bacteroidia bacterium]|nr:LysM peptidoglycan-binding domain-containing protein [Bacteroidia bacterium]